MSTREQFYLAASPTRGAVIARIVRLLGQLPMDKSFNVVVEAHKPRRSNAQNALLWSLYEDILKNGGEALRGYTREELHDFFLGNHFGWEVHDLFGKKKHLPRRRSSGLNKQEFSDLVDSIVRFMAERGVVLQLPGDTETA